MGYLVHKKLVGKVLARPYFTLHVDRASAPLWKVDPVPNSNDALLLAASRGDRSAFSRLYDSLAPRVHGVVLRIVVDPTEAAEVTGASFMEAWTRSADFDPDRGSARAWVIALAHQRAVAHIRTRPRPHELADRRLVHPALAGLSPAMRGIVELTYFGAYTHRELAETLQISTDAAASWIRDAWGLIQASAAAHTPGGQATTG